MPWVRFDDQFTLNRKIKGLDDAAYRLHTEAIFWCARQLTDGHIGATEIKQIVAKGQVGRLAGALVRAGLWHAPGHTCSCPQPVDGWVIHDYLEYQPSREKVGREREAKAERQKRWMDSRRRVSGASHSPPTDASQLASVDASGDAAPRDAAPYPVPAPPRPEGKRGGAPEHQPPAAVRQAGAGGGELDQKPRAVDPPPELMADLRKQLADVRARVRKPTLNGEAFARLAEATPGVSPFAEPDQEPA